MRRSVVMYKIDLPCMLSSPGIVVIGPESVIFTLLHLLVLGSFVITSLSPKGSPSTRGSSFSSGSSASSFSSPPPSDVSASAA